MPTKGIDRERLHKLAAMMDSPSRSEALTAFGLVLDELAKEQDARFSVEYSLGNLDAEEASEEMAKLRAELADALESAARHETTAKELGETIDRLHASMKEVDEHFEPVESPTPAPLPVQQKPVMPFEDWGADSNDLNQEKPRPQLLHSGPFTWRTFGTWTYGFAAVLLVAIVALKDNFAASPFFLPLVFIIGGVFGFSYFKKLHESHGWIGIAVKVCLTADLLLVVSLMFPLFDRIGYPQLTTREEVFGFAVGFGTLWFLYSERFFSWVLDEQKRTQFVVFPGAAFILVLVLIWVTGGNTKPVKAAAPPQRFSQSPHIRKHHPAPRPTPPPDNPPQILNYDFELPPRSSSPVLLETSYSPATAPPDLTAAVFQTSASSEDDSGVVVLFFLGLIVVVVLKLATSGESKAQKQKKFQKALNEANTPLAQNETGNAAHASMKDLKKRGWA